jgi:hypothetical protein
VPERRASRFAVEVLFLVALAVGLVLAEASPLLIGGLMLLGWLIVALFEWAAWRGEPHFGSGLPPRYYVPQISLPPRQPLEQVGLGYPAAEQRDEAPTWIASPALRAEVLGEWPVAAPAPGEETQEEPPTDESAVESEAEVESVETAEPEVVEPEVVEPEVVEPEVVEPEVVDLDEAAPAAGAGPRRRRLWGRHGKADESADPWTVTELPVEPETTEEPGEAPALAGLAPTAERTARHRLDPLPEPAPKRRLRRRHDQEDGPAIELPARPVGVRVLPGRSRRED